MTRGSQRAWWQDLPAATAIDLSAGRTELSATLVSPASAVSHSSERLSRLERVTQAIKYGECEGLTEAQWKTCKQACMRNASQLNNRSGARPNPAAGITAIMASWTLKQKELAFKA